MKKLIIIAAAFSLVSGGIAWGQMMGGANADDHTPKEEAEGKEVWNKLQAKEFTCGDLTEENFGQLGEYFMGQMMGDSHAAMNQMMIQVHGEEGEEQIHAAVGKRISGCDPEATFSGGTMGWMPMMNMMMGGWSALSNQKGNSMMGGYNMMNWGGCSWFVAFTWIVWTGVGVLLAIWLWQQITKK